MRQPKAVQERESEEEKNFEETRRVHRGKRSEELQRMPKWKETAKKRMVKEMKMKHKPVQKKRAEAVKEFLEWVVESDKRGKCETDAHKQVDDEGKEKKTKNSDRNCEEYPSPWRAAAAALERVRDRVFDNQNRTRS